MSLTFLRRFDEFRVELTRSRNTADIQEYLLLKGVEAVAIHGSKSKSILSLFQFRSDHGDPIMNSHNAKLIKIILSPSNSSGRA